VYIRQGCGKNFLQHVPFGYLINHEDSLWTHNTQYHNSERKPEKLIHVAFLEKETVSEMCHENLGELTVFMFVEKVVPPKILKISGSG